MRLSPALCLNLMSGFLLLFLVSMQTRSEDAPVKVDIKNVVEEVARSAGVDPSRVPLIVDAPADVAAKVCAVSKDVLMQQGGSGSAAAGCVATVTSRELERIVEQRVRANQ